MFPKQLFLTKSFFLLLLFGLVSIVVSQDMPDDEPVVDHQQPDVKELQYMKKIAILGAQNDFKEAVIYQEKLISYRDSVAQIEKSRAISIIQQQIETELNENDIALANARFQSQELRLEQQELQRYIYFGGGISLLILVIGLLSRLNYMRNTRNELQEKGMRIALEKLRVEESEQVREEFLAKMSHDIRTPMNVIMGTTNILRKNKKYPHQERYLDAIWQSSENLLVILNDIIDISKLESGTIDIENVAFKPMDEMMKLREILKYKAEEKGISLNCSLDENIPQSLLGDPVRLNQVLINLTGNAIKFTEKGNVLVQIKLKQIKGNVAIIEGVIEDSGIGIPDDRLDKIFESFTQAEGDTTRRYGGTGLGLTISKELIRLQNGKITVESELGKGSTFRFEIPYLITEEPVGLPKPEVEQEEPQIKLKTLKVLLVEDNQFNIMVAKDELREIIENVRIEIASNGREALEKVQQSDYDVVLMDIEMQEMNGYEATIAIRNLESAKKDVPIIAITAAAMKQEIEKCFEAGMNEHIPKPFDSALLKSKIIKVLQIKSSN